VRPADQRVTLNVVVGAACPRNFICWHGFASS
jgi:hypothetical protein